MHCAALRGRRSLPILPCLAVLSNPVPPHLGGGAYPNHMPPHVGGGAYPNPVQPHLGGGAYPILWPTLCRPDWAAAPTLTLGGGGVRPDCVQLTELYAY